MTILTRACYVFVINGMWAYGNLQIFHRGAYHFIDASDSFMKSGHLVTFNIMWILFALFTFIIVLLMRNWMSLHEMEVDEDLPKFFEVITLTAADMIVKEEEHCQ